MPIGAGESMNPRRRLLLAVLAVPVLTAGLVAVGDVSTESVAVAAPVVAAPIDDPLADLAQAALELLPPKGDPSSPEYLAARSRLADAVGLRLWTPGNLFDEAWGRADIEHQRALLAALTQLGVPYRRNASAPGVALDCSGLTSYAWAEAGFEIPRNSTAQILAAEPRTIFTAQAGDLMRYPGHVMMWLGVGQAIVHAPFTGRHVEIKVLGNRSMRRSKFGDPTE